MITTATSKTPIIGQLTSICSVTDISILPDSKTSPSTIVFKGIS